MRNTTERIFKAAIDVFARKGFTQATTQEIAKEADVAEITLYRKFSTKQNLFVSVIRKMIAHQFETDIIKWAETDDTQEFFSQIIRDRLNMVSKNEALIKMLLSESLMGNLSEDINLPVILYESIKKSVVAHLKHINKNGNAEMCARQIGGLLLSQVAFPHEQLFYQWPANEKETFVNAHVKAILSFVENNG